MDLKEKIFQIIIDLAKIYKKKYRESFFDVDFKMQKDSIVLEGKVLLLKQKELLKKSIKSVYKGFVIDNIIVLSDWNNGNKDFYYISPYSNILVNVYRKPISYFLKLPKRQRQKSLSTQIPENGFPFRIITEIKDLWLLIQIVDGTIGWIRKKTFYKNIESKKVLKFNLNDNFFKNQIDFKSISKKGFQKDCRQFIGMWYLLGGNSNKIIDCSALVQRIYFQIFGILLPKKSTLQRNFLLSKGECKSLIHPYFVNANHLQKFLEFVKKSDFGGLLFLKKKNKNRSSHVAIWLDKTNKLLIHSSHGRNGVEIDKLEDLMKDYEGW